MGAQDTATGQARAALSCFLRSFTDSTNVPSSRRFARPCEASRLHTTGQRLQRGRDLQHRFLGFTTRFFATREE